MKHLSKLYSGKNIITGMLIYGVGDTIAALLAGEFVLSRLLGMSFVGALIYSVEIPHYFRWVEKRTAKGVDIEVSRLGSELFLSSIPRSLFKTFLALLYFNPLWIMRHFLFIALFTGEIHSIFFSLFSIALNSFLIAIPVTITANFIIQNIIELKHRFIASALFSCAMAIYYPLMLLLE